MESRVVDPRTLPGEEELDLSLRPRDFLGYVGQDKIKTSLKISIQAAKQRQVPLDHILLFGPPGLGKTTLAHIIAHERGVSLKSTSGPAIERAGDLAAILTNLKDNDVLFIDEIHRLSRPIEEMLYAAMEDYYLDIIVGKGPSARSLKLDLPKFTLIGATTRVGLISSPLRDRFGATYRLDFYTEDDIRQILRRSSGILRIKLSDEAASIIARSSRRTPRTANRILKRVRDFALVKNRGVITLEVVDATLKLLAIDEAGLDEVDRKILEVMIKHFNGGPVGISSIAVSISEDRQTIEDVYEPYLIQGGFMRRTAQGRLAADRAYEHLGIPKPQSNLLPL